MESEEQRALRGRRSRGRSKLEGGVGVASLKLLLGLPVGVLWGPAPEADDPDNNDGVLSFLTLVRRAESIIKRMPPSVQNCYERKSKLNITYWFVIFAPFEAGKPITLLIGQFFNVWSGSGTISHWGFPRSFSGLGGLIIPIFYYFLLVWHSASFYEASIGRLGWCSLNVTTVTIVWRMGLEVCTVWGWSWGWRTIGKTSTCRWRSCHTIL